MLPQAPPENDSFDAKACTALRYTNQSLSSPYAKPKPAQVAQINKLMHQDKSAD